MRYFLICLAICATVIGANAASNAEFREGTSEWKILAAELPKLNERFGGYSPGPRVQKLSHPDGTTSILVFSFAAGPKPVLFRVGEDEKIIWSNYKPLIEVGFSYQTRLAVNGNEDLLLWYDSNLNTVWARAFDEEGKTRWTREVLKIPWNEKKEEYVLSLNASSWGKHGWAVAFVTDRQAGLQRLDFEGKQVWKEAQSFNGDYVYGTVSLIQDSPDTVFALWRGSPERWSALVSVFQAMRVKFDATLVWPKPIKVGPAPSLSMMEPREIDLKVVQDGVIAELYEGFAMDIGPDPNANLTDYQARIDRDGQVEILKTQTTQNTGK